MTSDENEAKLVKVLKSPQRSRSKTILLCLGQNCEQQRQQAATGSGDFHEEGTPCTVSGRPAAGADIGSSMAFHDIRAKTLDGQVVTMDKYKGKVVLVENTASL